MGNIEQRADPTRIVLHDCEVDVAQCELVRGGERQHLTTKEVELLVYLARHPSRNVSYEELLERVWGHPRLASTQPVYSVVKRLRRKIDGGEHRHLVTVHGVGYRFEPPLRSLALEPALPTARSVSSFVGRSRELVALDAALDGGARIVTLVGPGGAGKTRLGLELCARLASRGEEIVFVDLSDLPPEMDAAATVASVLGVRASGDDDPCSMPAILRTARARSVWALLLDNAEHVVASVAAIAVALAPSVRIVATSRERLGVPGEHVVEVGSLAPDDAVRLFSDRARAAGKITDAGRVASIVARLDGLPLGIELAAAHAGVVSLERVELDLDRQLDALAATRRGVPSRHTTLRASIEWSWSLLTPHERAVLAQCVVFSGGFTLEAAAAVIEGPGPIASHLLRLAERSLLRPIDAAGTTRFSPYEAVRELAAEHLDRRADVEDRHAAWALARAIEVGALRSVPPASALADLTPDAANLRVAFQRSLERDPERAASLAIAIDLLDTPTRGPGRAPELRAALRRTTGATTVRLRLALGPSAGGADDLGFLRDTATLARELGTVTEQLEADRAVAAALSALGDPGAALGPLEDALVRARAHAPGTAVLGRIALELAETQLAAGSVARAEALASEAERLFETVGEPGLAARAASALSHVHRERGEPEASLSALERARRALEDVGDEVALARLQLDRGVVLAHLGRSGEAALALEAATRAHRRLGLGAGELRARDWHVLALLGLGRDEDALAEAREMQVLAHGLGRPSHEAERAFAATWLVTGRLAEADAAFGRALALLEASGKATVRGHVLSARALGRLLAGRLGDAEVDLVASSEIHRGRGSEAARLHAAAELALVREITSPRTETDVVLRAAEAACAAPWERRHARGRRAVVEIVRARRAGRPPEELSAIATAVRAELAGSAGPDDYFTRTTLVLVEHVARGV